MVDDWLNFKKEIQRERYGQIKRQKEGERDRVRERMREREKERQRMKKLYGQFSKSLVIQAISFFSYFQQKGFNLSL